MDAPTRLIRRAQRFLEGLVKECGPDAATWLRTWADELERIASEVAIEVENEAPRSRH